MVQVQPLGYHQHSQLGAYLCTAFVSCVAAIQLIPGVLEKYALAKKWWWFLGAIAYSAYLYLRPFIRTRLGSASHAYINYRTCYIAWLCGALAYHTPSLEALGLNVRADVSLCIVVALSTLGALVALVGLHEVALHAGVLRSPLFCMSAPGSQLGTRELVAALLLNSANLALACSAYHSLCGNGLAGGGLVQRAGVTGDAAGLRAAVCAKWLHPVPTEHYPRFSAWMLYGEGGDSGSATTPAPTSSQSTPSGSDTPLNATAMLLNATARALQGQGVITAQGQQQDRHTSGFITIDYPLDGRGAVEVAAGAVLSPVLTLWVTLMVLYIANVVADHSAATVLDTPHMAELRRPVDVSAGGADPRRLLAQLGERVRAQRDVGYQRLRGAVTSRRGRGALDVRKPISKGQGSGPPPAHASSMSALTKSAGSTLSTLVARGMRATARYWQPLSPSAASGSAERGVEGSCGPATSERTGGGSGAASDSGSERYAGSKRGGKATSAGTTKLGASSGLDGSKVGISGAVGGRGAVGAHGRSGMAGEAGEGGAGAGGAQDEEPQPQFLDMVPWYSGTSADLLKTCFDLIVSVKLFLGRFDMRTLQAATGSSQDMGGGRDAYHAAGGCGPAEGDGYTYEQYAEREELWLDFIADTGDGGNSTYTVARALAAPQLHVRVPSDLSHVGSTAAAPGSSTLASVSKQHLQHLGGGFARESASSTCSSAASSARGSHEVPEGGHVAHKHHGAAAMHPFSAVQEAAAAGAKGAQQQQQQHAAAVHGLVLPRADVLLLGGDLAYPNPTKETYEQRLLRPFQDAMPPPPHYHPGRLVVHKPDLPPTYGVQAAAGGGELRGLSPRASRHAAASALRTYPGPSAFAIPGNHDWIDGLETFTSYIQHKGWLGGWLLPQEKSYWALKGPHGWWVFGLDLALTGDIDACQLRYFADVVEQRLAPDDAVAIITHEPCWLLEWFWQRPAAANLRQLVRGHLRGRARVHLAGDLHFYMRHSYVAARDGPPEESSEESPQGQAQPAGVPGGAAGAAPSRAAAAARAAQAVQGPDARGGPGATATPGGERMGGLNTNRQDGEGAARSRDVAGAGAAAGSGSAHHNPQRQAPISQEAGGRTGAGAGVKPQSHLTLPSLTRTPSTASIHGLSPRSSQGQATMGFGASPPPASSHVVAAGVTPVGSVGAGAGSQGVTSPGTAAKGAAPATGGSVSGMSTPQTSFRRSYSTNAFPAGAPSLRGPAAGTGAGTAVTAAGGSSDDEVESVSGTSYTSGTHRSRRVTCTGSLRGSSPGASRRAAARQLPALQLMVEEGLLAGLGQSSGMAGGGHGMPDTALGALGAGARPEAVPEGNDGVGGRPGTCYACIAKQQEMRMHSFDPEHLICNGAGGAFMHPTHVFAPAAFTPCQDAAADATAALYSAAHMPCTCQVYSYNTQTAWGVGTGPGKHARWPSGTVGGGAATGGGSAAGSTAARLQRNGSGSGNGGGVGDGVELGRYTCRVAFPSPARSLELGRKNLHLFRLQNTRFDVIGGMLYFLLVVSIIPRCPNLSTWLPASPADLATAGGVHGPHASGQQHHPWGSIASVLDADSSMAALTALGAAILDTFAALLCSSYISLGASVALFALCIAFAKAGGVGAVPQLAPNHLNPPEPSDPAAREAAWRGAVHVPPAPFRARIGGFGMQLLWGGAHAALHLTLAVLLVLVLELGLEMCVRHERLGQDGMHSLFRWYQAFEAQHFPDPRGVRALLQRITLGAYPGLLKAAMAVFDIPEAVAVTRTAVCAAGGSLAAVSRLQALGYYAGMLAYYWLLATPAVGAVFGLYLYAGCVWGHVFYDEAYSSLRLPHHKALTRLHITRDGQLRVYTIGVDRVPSRWVEEPGWRGALGGGNGATPAHAAALPSRWRPAPDQGLCDVLGAAGEGAAHGQSGEGAHGSGAPGGAGPQGGTGTGTVARGERGPGGAAAGGKVGKPPRAPGSTHQHQVAVHQGGGGVAGGKPGGKQGHGGAGGRGGDLDWFLVDYLCVPKHRTV